MTISNNLSVCKPYFCLVIYRKIQLMQSMNLNVFGDSTTSENVSCLSAVLIALFDFGWLVVFGLNGPLRQYFSLYRAVSQREGEGREK